MASIRPAGLGPIVGHTTEKTCRVWMRASDPADDKEDLDEFRRTLGVIGLVTKGRIKAGNAWYFRLQREYDRTGTFVLGSDVQLGCYYPNDYTAPDGTVPAKPPVEAVATPLTPDTEYTVRVGSLTIDDPMPNDASLSDRELLKRLPKIDNISRELLKFKPEECEATFRTFPASDVVADKLSFLLGSCRYPGWLWKVKEADRIFAPMLTHLTPGNAFGDAARFTVMCGDQIYADEFNRMFPIGRADTFKEFQERYHAAFGAPNLRDLLRRATTYMVLDDHEIEDNWTQDRLESQHQLFTLAISAYQSYQWSHGPRTWKQLFYSTFDCAGYPAFVLDTRTQRYKDDQVGLLDNHLLGRPSLDPVNHPGQLQRLLEWLSAEQRDRGNVPKFIVTSSVFAPNDMSERIDPTPKDDAGADALYGFNAARRGDSDSWPAYPTTRLRLLKHIVENRIQNVVFLSGDIHCSNVAEIEFSGNAGRDLKAFSVTSSAFYWPFPFADGDPNNYVHDSRKAGQKDPFPIADTDAVMNYRAFGFTQEDNFSRIDIDKAAATLTVRIFDNKGKLVTVDGRNGNATTANVLQMAAW